VELSERSIFRETISQPEERSFSTLSAISDHSTEVTKSLTMRSSSQQAWNINTKYFSASSAYQQSRISMTASFRLIAIYAEAEMRSHARRYVADCAVTALDLEPTRPWFLVKTNTDAERDLLTGNEALLKEFKAVFRARECPDEIIQALTFTFQSQETMERDHAGNWQWALT
jgi:hypothetical protein